MDFSNLFESGAKERKWPEPLLAVSRLTEKASGSHNPVSGESAS